MALERGCTIVGKIANYLDLLKKWWKNLEPLFYGNSGNFVEL